jgi:anaerobic selenocysteine-containing dehydrogenase
MSSREIIDETLRVSGRGGLAELEAQGWIDCRAPYREAHYLDGFGHADGKFHFRADWPNTPYGNIGLRGDWAAMPALPDHWASNEASDAEHPFKLTTSPARNFLNSSFNGTATSRAREDRPTALVHPDDAERLGVIDGGVLRLGNTRGAVRLHARLSKAVRPGVIVSEGLWENRDFLDGRGINTLTSDESVAPFGGAAFHDIRVWAKAEAAALRQAAE